MGGAPPLPPLQPSLGGVGAARVAARPQGSGRAEAAGFSFRVGAGEDAEAETEAGGAAAAEAAGLTWDGGMGRAAAEAATEA